MLGRGRYDMAIALYERVLAGRLTAADRREAQQGLTWARQLRDAAAKTKKPSPDSATSARTVADRLLAACGFEEAAAAYGAAGADPVRVEAARRLIALRRAAAAKLSGTRLPVTLKSGARVTLCRIGRRSAQLAGAAGGVSPRDWSALDREDIARIYQACFTKPTAEDRLNLGILCLVLGVRNQAQREFSEAARLDPAKQADAERFLVLKFSR